MTVPHADPCWHNLRLTEWQAILKLTRQPDRVSHAKTEAGTVAETLNDVFARSDASQLHQRTQMLSKRIRRERLQAGV
ncbi:hypothetical protein BC832DRAFT_558474 [Gaertneriomyces semiglobifer]|nr:hypothetical protein BC832DRAFT_558474 [Gaertneriomyces semiglobifer]